MGESANTRALCRVLEAQGAMTYPLIGGHWSPPGWPDRFVAHRLWTGFLEFKQGKGKTNALQRRILTGLSDRGINVAVVRFNDSGDRVSVTGEYVKFSELLELLELLGRLGTLELGV